MKNRPEASAIADQKLIRFLIEAGHTSVFEHCVMTFYIENVSRSLLAQLTRHRMGSFTAASQHYQDYSDMPMIVHPNVDTNYNVAHGLKDALDRYVEAMKDEIPKEEARQLLPNACAVNIMWTVNLRSLLNFFEQRLCLRNVAEMQWFATEIRRQVQGYWPDFAEYCAPPCGHGACNQGVMSCGKEWNEGEKV